MSSTTILENVLAPDFSLVLAPQMAKLRARMKVTREKDPGETG